MFLLKCESIIIDCNNESHNIKLPLDNKEDIDINKLKNNTDKKDKKNIVDNLSNRKLDIDNVFLFSDTDNKIFIKSDNIKI